VYRNCTKVKRFFIYFYSSDFCLKTKHSLY